MRLHKIAFLLLTLLAACASDAKRIQAALRTGLTAVDSAQVAFASYDDRHQQEIVRAAKDRDEAEREIARYRDRRQPVLIAFTAAYAAIASAAAIAPLVDEGKRTPAAFWRALEEAALATAAAQAAVKQIRSEDP